MITKYGMSDTLGPVVFGTSSSGEVFLGRDFGHTRDYSEEIAAQIDSEVKNIMTSAYERCKQKLTEHREKLDEVAEYLIAHEKMDGEQFKAMMEGREIPEFSSTSLFTTSEEKSE
jgi:cell division protease FtsH